MRDNVTIPSLTPLFLHRLCIRPFQKLIQLCCRTSGQDHPITAHAASLDRGTSLSKQRNEHLVFCEAKNMQDGGFGRYSLSERIQNFGGTLTIDTAPGSGYTHHYHNPAADKKKHP